MGAWRSEGEVRVKGGSHVVVDSRRFGVLVETDFEKSKC